MKIGYFSPTQVDAVVVWVGFRTCSQSTYIFGQQLHPRDEENTELESAGVETAESSNQSQKRFSVAHDSIVSFSRFYFLHLSCIFFVRCSFCARGALYCAGRVFESIVADGVFTVCGCSFTTGVSDIVRQLVASIYILRCVGNAFSCRSEQH